MIKRLIIFLSIVSILVSLPLISANAAAKAGGACLKAGVTSVSSGKKYICIKSGKKLVWSLINSASKSSTTNNAPISVVNNSPVDNCKIKDLRDSITMGIGGGSVGFPLSFNKIKPNGVIKVGIIPVNFPGSPKVNKPESYLRKYLDLLDQRN